MRPTRAIVGAIVLGLAGAVAEDRARLTGRQASLEVFEAVWNKVNETYFDPSFGGVDWKMLHDRYRPLVTAALGSNAAVVETTERCLQHEPAGRQAADPRTLYCRIKTSASEISDHAMPSAQQ